MKRRIVLSSIVVLVLCLATVFSLGIFQSVMNLRDRSEAAGTYTFTSAEAISIDVYNDYDKFIINSPEGFIGFANTTRYVDSIFEYDDCKITCFYKKVIELASDIDLSGLLDDAFYPIASAKGEYGERMEYFCGTFDGKGFSITGLSLSCVLADGLFWGLSTSATVKNLKIKDIELYHGSGGTRPVNVFDTYAGVICRENNGTIENCVVENVKFTSNRFQSNCNVAAIAGINNGTIKNCIVEGNYTLKADGDNGILNDDGMMAYYFRASGNQATNCVFNAEVYETEAGDDDQIILPSVNDSKAFKDKANFLYFDGSDETLEANTNLTKDVDSDLNGTTPWYRYLDRYNHYNSRAEVYLRAFVKKVAVSFVVEPSSSGSVDKSSITVPLGCDYGTNKGTTIEVYGHDVTVSENAGCYFSYWSGPHRDSNGNALYKALFDQVYETTFTTLWIDGANRYPKIECDCADECWEYGDYGNAIIDIIQNTSIRAVFEPASESGYYTLFEFNTNGCEHRVIYPVPKGYVPYNYEGLYTYYSDYDGYRDGYIYLNKGGSTVVNKEISFSVWFRQETYSLTIINNADAYVGSRDLNTTDSTTATTEDNKIIINNIPGGTILNVSDLFTTELEFNLSGAYNINYYLNDGYTFDYATYYNTSIAMSEDLTIYIGAYWSGYKNILFSIGSYNSVTNERYDPLYNNYYRWYEGFDVSVDTNDSIWVSYEMEGDYYTHIEVDVGNGYHIVLDVEDVYEVLGKNIVFTEIIYYGLTGYGPYYPSGESPICDITIKWKEVVNLTFKPIENAYLYECYQNGNGDWVDGSKWLSSYEDSDLVEFKNYSTINIIKTLDGFDNMVLIANVSIVNGYKVLTYSLNDDTELVSYLFKYSDIEIDADCDTQYSDTHWDMDIRNNTIIEPSLVDGPGTITFANSYEQVSAQYTFTPSTGSGYTSSIDDNNSKVYLMGKAIEIQPTGVMIYEMQEPTVYTNADLTEVEFNYSTTMTTYGNVNLENVAYEYLAGDHQVIYSINDDYIDSWRFEERSYNTSVGYPSFEVMADTISEIPTSVDDYYIDLWVEQPVGDQVSFKSGFYAWSLGNSFEAYIGANLYRGTNINDDNKLDSDNLAGTHFSYDSASGEYRISVLLDGWIVVSGYHEIDNETDTNRYIFTFIAGSSDGSYEEYSLVYDFSNEDHNEYYTLIYNISDNWNVSDWNELTSSDDYLGIDQGCYKLVVSYKYRAYEIDK